MATTAPAPTPAPGPTVVDRVTARFDLSDRRNLLGLGVLCFCAGIMVGARLMRGMPTQLTEATPDPHPKGSPEQTGPVVYVPQPCADCAERAIQKERAAQRAAEAAQRPQATQEAAADDDAARAAAVERQQVAPEGMRTFSPYAEATLPAELVEQGDSSVPENG